MRGAESTELVVAGIGKVKSESVNEYSELLEVASTLL